MIIKALGKTFDLVDWFTPCDEEGHPHYGWPLFFYRTVLSFAAIFFGFTGVVLLFSLALWDFTGLINLFTTPHWFLIRLVILGSPLFNAVLMYLEAEW